MISIDIKSRYYNLSLNLEHKVTIIRGDSGRGKSIFYNIIAFPSRYKVRLSVTENVELIALLETSYADNLSSKKRNKQRRVFIADDDDFVFSKRFAEMIRDNDKDLFVIINRFETRSISSLGDIPFSVDSVFRWKAKGVNHIIEPYYTCDSGYCFNKFDVVLVEDKASGFSFFENTVKNADVYTLDGKDNMENKITDLVDKLYGKNICIFVDLSAFGSSFESLYSAINMYNLRVYMNFDYLCFEYLLLSSNMFGFNIKDISFEERIRYISLEHLCEDYIHRLTSGKPYKYTKRYPINSCYIKDCCFRRGSKNVCDNGISGNKIRELFKGTEFEDMIEVLINS